MAELTQVAWRTSAPEFDFLRRWTMQHLVLDGGGFTLCGVKVSWPLVGSGDGRRCTRCWVIAAKRGLPTEENG